MVEIGGLEPLASLSSIPAPPQPHQSFINPSPDVHHALVEAPRSLADTADALRRLAEALEAPSHTNHLAKEPHRNGDSTDVDWPLP